MSETGHEYRKQYPIIRPSVLKELAHGICVSNLAFHTGKQMNCSEEMCHKLAIAGGVAANRRIRADLQAACARSGDRLYLPELKYCGDNAAMIGCQGFYEYQAGHTAGMELNAYANRDISLG